MHIPSSDRNGTTVLILQGAILGGPEANALNEELHRLIDEGKKQVVIDLSRVTLMNSSGLGMLIGGYTTMKNNGGELKLACLTENVSKLIEITKLHTIFMSFGTVDEAVASFAS
ncbi:MAG: STAS domain-containing protein [Bacteroidota bacterium]|jgi:anti-sigma B factor antagonist